MREREREGVRVRVSLPEYGEQVSKVAVALDDLYLIPLSSCICCVLCVAMLYCVLTCVHVEYLQVVNE